MPNGLFRWNLPYWDMDSGNIIKTSSYLPFFAQDKHGYACCTVRYLEEALDSLYWGFECGVIHGVNRAFWVADRYVNVLVAKRSGKGAKRLVEEAKLSRYSCYHILQNVNSSKNDVTLTRFGQVNKKE